ncbi:MAG TPA: PH domain-containing protein [Thermoanaerobaculia bacterium]|nr:PH domain-containing protein [Thermoanaerobaculia bacterium]HUM30624.1 PH domain-containing protein [Thermoanaerobaculia bacterium]HXK68848.1 PH domain-containing protein [Thermoanaerobaculia bacterium]
MVEFVKSMVFPLLKVTEKAPAPLPGHRQGEYLEILRACPEYLQYKLFFWRIYAVIWGVAIFVLCAIFLFLGPLWALLTIPLMVVGAYKAAVLYVVTCLDYQMRWYVLTDRSLLIRQGVWVVREICLTFANAQNVHIRQGPIQRWFGFSSVEIDTAGGGGKSKEEEGMHTHRAVLRGLKEPYKVRDHILELLKKHRGAGLGDPDDPTGEERSGREIDAELLKGIHHEIREIRAALAGADAG